jgi:Streptomyces sporulation and cell division protein, SsgA
VRNPTISAVIGLQLVRYQHAIKVPARLSYSSEDPYAVHIAFCVGKGEPVEWMVARDLLSTGMWRRTGVGDVTVWPSVGSATGVSGSVMNIEISSPNGQAHFEAAVKEISNFLRGTYLVVPEGEESVHLDAELTNLLRSASLAQGGPSRGGPREGTTTGSPTCCTRR